MPAAMIRLLLAGCALLSCPTDAALAQDAPPDIAGIWSGDLNPPGSEPLEMVFWIERDGDGWRGLVDTPPQGAFGLPGKVTYRDGECSMHVTATGGEYRATLSEDGKQLDGDWLQRGTELELGCTPKPPAPTIPESLRKAVVGTWEGPLAVGAVELRLVLAVELDEQGKIQGHMASPDQGNRTFPITRTDLLDDGYLRFCIGATFSTFAMAPAEDGAALVGQYSQGGRSYDITLQRVDKPTEVNRPQEPKPPFPYSSREVTYENEAAEVTLAGTLTIPEGEGPFPTALLITGSGAQDRDETIFQHKPFWVLADHLSRRGIAVLRVDDRGIGGSTKGANPEAATSADFAEDVLAGVAFLKTQDEVAPGRIGLIGHSEGGIIAPMVAAQSSDVAFLVLLAGTGIPGADISVMQVELLSRAQEPEEEVENTVALQKKLVGLARNASLSNAEIGDGIRAILRDKAAEDDEEIDEKEIESTINQLTNPWVRYFFDHDPAPVLEKVHCPILAVNGTLDLQVPYEINLQTIEQALARGGNVDYEVHAFEGLNHLFQHCETGQVTEYGKIEETFAPEALDYVTDWIARRFVEPR